MRLRLVHKAIFKFLRCEDNAAVFKVSMDIKALKMLIFSKLTILSIGVCVPSYLTLFLSFPRLSNFSGVGNQDGLRRIQNLFETHS